MLKLAALVLCIGATVLAGPRSYMKRPLPDGRIVGGSEVDIKQIPHQLSLQVLGSHSCGASVISVDWAVTAAHCVRGMPSLFMNLRAGTSTRGSGGTVHSISQVIAHEQYSSSTIDYDIALIKVSSPFQLSDSVQPIALQDQGDVVASGTPAVVSGWGTTTEGGSSSRQLLQVEVPIVSAQECDLAYQEYNGITDRMLCAGVPEGGKDACQGDSGGPLSANEKLVGVVSWGAGCARAGYPGVYAQVSALRDWVKQKSGI